MHFFLPEEEIREILHLLAMKMELSSVKAKPDWRLHMLRLEVQIGLQNPFECQLKIMVKC